MLDKIPKPPLPIDVCSFILYPSKDAGYGIRVTGIYLPPSAEATPAMLSTLTKANYQSCGLQGGSLSHLILGDLNPNCWKGTKKAGFTEWLMEDGLWELTDPQLATFKTGSSLDKVLLKPGIDIPEEWLSLTGATAEEPLGGNKLSAFDPQHYPAVVFPNP